MKKLVLVIAVVLLVTMATAALADDNAKQWVLRPGISEDKKPALALDYRWGEHYYASLSWQDTCGRNDLKSVYLGYRGKVGKLEPRAGVGVARERDNSFAWEAGATYWFKQGEKTDLGLTVLYSDRSGRAHSHGRNKDRDHLTLGLSVAF